MFCKCLQVVYESNQRNCCQRCEFVACLCGRLNVFEREVAERSGRKKRLIIIEFQVHLFKGILQTATRSAFERWKLLSSARESLHSDSSLTLAQRKQTMALGLHGAFSLVLSLACTPRSGRTTSGLVSPKRWLWGSMLSLSLPPDSSNLYLGGIPLLQEENRGQP